MNLWLTDNDGEVMRLVLHIGTEKTGTTSFQRFCDSNRDALIEQGILYPRNLCLPEQGNHRFVSMYGLSEKNVDDGMRRLGITAKDEIESFHRNISSTLSDQIKKAGQCEICLISSEHLHSRLKTVSQVERIHGLLHALFDDIDVYVHLRPQVEVLVSLASTQARAGGAVRQTFFDQADPRNMYYNYANMVGMWEAVFGRDKVHCVPFKSSPDFLEYISEPIGLERSGLAQPRRVNEAIDVRVMAMINALVDSGTRHRIPGRVINQLPVEEKLSFSLAMAKNIQQRFDLSNASLIQRRGDLKPGDLDPDWSRYPENGNSHILEESCSFSNLFASLVAYYNHQMERSIPQKS